MESKAKVAPEAFVEKMKVEMEAYLQGVMEAVNEAPDGAWIGGSEEQVRDLSAEFRRQAFERAIQMKVNAAEAAFPPSALPDNRKATGQ